MTSRQINTNTGYRRAKLTQLIREIKLHGGASIPWPPWPNKEHLQNEYVVPHTHIDIEWQMTFEETLENIIGPLVNRVLKLLETEPDFKFTFDGQVGSIFDYLDTLGKTERAKIFERLSKYVKSGRLSVGPGERSVDQLHDSGETQLRNLEIGIKHSEALGRSMMIGHFPDQFGLSSGTPKILNHVGIHSATGVRGISRSTPRLLDFKSSDGSSVILFNIKEGYNHSNLGVRDFINAARRNHGKPSLFLAGFDQTIPKVDVVYAARKAGVKLSVLSEFFDALDINQEKPTIEGELRNTGDHFILPNVTSNRVDLRIEKATAERELERYAEVLAALILKQYPKKEFEHAWKLRLMVAAHDSSNATVADNVSKDIQQRVAEITDITSSISTQALHELSTQLKKAGDYVWNPSNFPRDLWANKDGVESFAKNVLPLGWAPIHPADISNDRIQKVPKFRFTTQRDYGDTYTFNPKGKEADYDLPVSLSQKLREPFLRLNVAWTNSTKNHRIRLLIKLPNRADETVADSAFDHVIRPAAPQLLQGRDRLNGYPASKFILAGGLAILLDRTAEYELLPQTNELAISLVRAHGALSISNPKYRYLWAGPRVKTYDTQMLKPIEWNIGIMSWESLDNLPWKEWEMFALPGRVFQSYGGGTLDESGQLLRDVPDGVLSAVLPEKIRTFSAAKGHKINEQTFERTINPKS